MKVTWIVWLVVGGPLFLAGCGKSASTPPPQRRTTAVPVTVARVETAAWDRAIPVIGTLFAKDEAAVSAEVEGTVESTLVDFGDRVADGQELAHIDTKAYKALAEQAAGNLAKAEANATNAERNLKRIHELNQSSISSASELDQAIAQAEQGRAEVKAAKGANAIAQLNLARSKVRAPFDGAIAQRIVGRGDFVKIGSPLFQLVNDSVLKFTFQVPERYASQVRTNLQVTFTVDNYPGETFAGNVYLISPAVNTASRAFNVAASVANPAHKLKANSFARGSLLLERNVPTPVIPLEAVVNFAGVTKVFVVENELVKGRTLQVGRIQASRQEVVSGLKLGETVVVTGQTKLYDGAKIVLKSNEGEVPVPPTKGDKKLSAAAHE